MPFILETVMYYLHVRHWKFKNFRLVEIFRVATTINLLKRLDRSYEEKIEFTSTKKILHFDNYRILYTFDRNKWRRYQRSFAMVATGERQQFWRIWCARYDDINELQLPSNSWDDDWWIEGWSINKIFGNLKWLICLFCR